MKKITFLLTLIVSALSLNGQVLEGLYVESIPVESSLGLPENSVTYRIFVNLINDCGLVDIYANEEHPISIKTNTEFYNHEFGATTGDKVLQALVDIFPVLSVDSWLSIGGASNTAIGVPRSVEESGKVDGTPVETFLSPGLDLSMFFQAPSALEFSSTDGLWGGLVQGGVSYQEISPENMVLIGQFTTNGILSYELNLDIKDPDNKAFVYVTKLHPEDSEVIRYYPTLKGVAGPGISEPTVNITSPLNNARFAPGTKTTIQAGAMVDGSTIDSVDFIVNDKKTGTDYTAPFSLEFQSDEENSFRITAVAFARNGARAMSEAVNITYTTEAINQEPRVSIQSPQESDILLAGLNVTLEADAYDTDGTIDSVEFLVDGTKIGADLNGVAVNDSVARFSINWLATPGTFTFIAIAWDNENAMTSDTLEGIRVNSAPVVSITSPSDQSVFEEGQEITVSAEASDEDGSVTRVDFLVNGIVAVEDTDAPFEMNWSGGTGEYLFVARAFDNDFAMGADTVQITVAHTNSAAELKLREFTVYPNPADEYILITIHNKFLNDDRITVQMIDMQGRILIEKEVQDVREVKEIQIKTDHLSNGTYLIKLASGQNCAFGYIVKQSS